MPPGSEAWSALPLGAAGHPTSPCAHRSYSSPKACLPMSDAPPFISGLELNHAYYEEAVRPILNHYAPELAYSAALIGYGSDVLGYDTESSTDHEWGPRLLLFLDEPTYATRADEIGRRF